MPYIHAMFDSATEEAIKATASTLKDGSPFTPYTDLHVPLLGSLHVYSEETIAAAIESAAPLPGGRFLKLELHGLRGLHELRATIEFDDAIRLHEKLPRGRPWRSTYVALGTIDMEAAQRDEFLAAVTSAFPMSADVTFATSRLGYHNNVPTAPTRRKLQLPDRPGSSSKSRLNPKAPPFDPTRGVQKSRHLKSERRPAAAASTRSASTVDELIKKTRAPRTRRAVKPAPTKKKAAEPPRLSTGLSMNMERMAMALGEAE